MKNRLLILVVVLMAASILLSSCWYDKIYEVQEKPYYSDKSNYVTFTGVVDFLKIKDDTLYFSIEAEENEYSETYWLEQQNYNTVVDNGIMEDLSIGDTIQFSAAPRIFGDGYIIPVVSISIGDKVYLEFDEGYANLLKDRYGIIPKTGDGSVSSVD